MDTFSQLKADFSYKIEDVKEMFRSRIQDPLQNIYKDELLQLEDDITSKEEDIDILESFINEEKDCLNMVISLEKAQQIQRDVLNHIADSLPNRLPCLDNSKAFHYTYVNVPTPVSQAAESKRNIIKVKREDVKSCLINKENDKKLKVPRRYINEDELLSVSSYMRGRLNTQKINKAIDEIADLSETNAKFISQVKSKRNMMTIAERKKAIEILNSVARQGDVSAKFFFTEADLKGGTHIKLDKTGKSIITLLRHLGRIHEVRILADDSTKIVYVLI